MRKKFTLLTAALLLLTMINLPGKAVGQTNVTINFGTSTGYWAAHSTASYTDSDSRSWSRTFSAGGKYSGGATYSQFGNSSNTCTSLVLTAIAGSDINVTAFSVTMKGASATTAGTIYLYKTTGETDTQLATATVSGTEDVICSFSGLQAFSSTDILKVDYVGTAKAIQITQMSYSYIPGGSSAEATSTEITVPSNFNNDLKNGTSAGTLTASVTETVSGDAVSGATVTWESSNTDVATINANGVVSLVAVGTTTITASYAGVEDEYLPSYDEYELEVVDSRYSISDLTFTAACGGSGTASDGAEWEVNSDAVESTFDNNRGIHYGTGSVAVTYVQLATSDIDGQVTKVVVNASDAQGASTISVTVGGVAFTCTGSTTVTNSTPGVDYTFTGTGSGEIVVLIDRGESMVKAIYVKSVKVTYQEVAVKAPVITVPEAFIGSTTATITCETTGATIYYSYDNSTWTEYTAALAITQTTTIYAKAVKGTDESAVVSATTTRELPEPTVIIDATGINNTDVYVSTVAGSLAATVNYSGAAITGATVTWSGDNNNVATINASTGAVTLVAAGTVNFTATFAGNADYSSASATYELTVTSSAPYVQQMEVEVNLNNTFFDCNAFTAWSSGMATNYSGMQDNVTITLDKGTGEYMYINTTGIRMYAGNSLTFTAPDGYKIISIELEGTSGFSDNLEAEVGSLSNGTWTGTATQVEITGNTNRKNMTKATITLAIPCNIVGNTWYFIASPTGTAPTNINDLGDLYYYDEQNHFWRNKKQHDTGFDFGYGKGYLCANETAAVQLSFTGTLLANDTYSVPVTYNATTSENGSNSLAGWNLVGNPFNSNATLDVDCYILNGSSINTQAQTTGYVIAPFAGVMVKASATGSVLFTKVTENAPAPQPNQVQIVVEQKVLSRGVASTSVHDNAIINFNEGSQLEKFSFNPDAAKLYIPQNGKDYAVVSVEAQGEMPVNFKASTDGEYTITVNPEGVELNYLHLIDNMTGMDVNLLQTPSYTFDATTRDYESRFRLVFAGASTSSATDETFAYYDGSEWQVSNEGEATLQVVDVMGRIVSTETVNGNFNLNLNQTAGVYMLRLINSNGVKTQKIVVR